jgi:hypothetical protein
MAIVHTLAYFDALASLDSYIPELDLFGGKVNGVGKLDRSHPQFPALVLCLLHAESTISVNVVGSRGL